MKLLLKKLLPPLSIEIYRLIKNKFKKSKLNIDPSKQDLNIYYSKEMSEILDRWGERNAWIEIQHIFQDKRRNKILDIACGTGIVIDILKKNLGINNIHGCDISDFLIKKAITKGIKEENLVICDATDLPYQENEFDYNYSIGSLEHFTKDGIIKFLKSSIRVTKYTGFHMIPVSRNNKDNGWINNYQSYFNNSEKWWADLCTQVTSDFYFLDSSWEDEISVGKWLIINKIDKK